MKFRGAVDLRTTRVARAPAVAVRAPFVVPRVPRSLQEAMADVGIAPRARSHRPPGLLRRWFTAEAIPLAAFNALFSLALLTLAVTMTAIGMQLVVALDLAATMYVVLNDGLPYAGLALLVGGLAKATQTRLTHRGDAFGTVLGSSAAALLFAGGLWLEVMLGYANFVPWMFKPILALAGGELAVRFDAVDRILISYFEPATVGFVAFLLAAKQIRTSVDAGRHRTRAYLALIGLAASAGALAISSYAAHRHFISADFADRGYYAIGGDVLSDGSHTYGSLFAPGVRCRVSDVFGRRIDPLDSGRLEDHRGIDLAVKQGTPVHAMANGRIMFAEYDAGLGNMVALRVDGTHQPTLLAGHMESLAVKTGDLVKRGDLVGYAGSTGRSTGPHVHLQVCPDARTHSGGLVCGHAENPYEVWPALAALARMSCSDGPQIY